MSTKGALIPFKWDTALEIMVTIDKRKTPPQQYVTAEKSQMLSSQW